MKNSTEEKSATQNHAEVGLSSAMHDIRELANLYAKASARTSFIADAEFESAISREAELPCPPDMRLLPPVPKRGAGHWKSAALATMVLCGLGTSAYALTTIDSNDAASEPMLRAFEVESDELPRGPVRVIPNEEPLSVIASSDDSVSLSEAAPARVESHRAVAPMLSEKKAKPAARQASKEVNSCDEVTCLVDPSAACCFPDEVEDSEPVVEVSRAYRPERSEINSLMASIDGRIHACFDRYDVSGVATANIKLAESGSVSAVRVSAGSADFQACVADTVQGLVFQPLRQPFQFAYAFVYR